LYPNRKGKFHFEVYSPAKFELQASKDYEYNTIKNIPPSARREKKEDTVVKENNKEEDTNSFSSTTTSFLTTYQFEFGGIKPKV
jgi:hypothetical protein